jgi:hypothetical protein
MVGNGDGHGGLCGAFLHDHVTSLAAHFDESVLAEERTEFSTREDA